MATPTVAVTIAADDEATQVLKLVRSELAKLDTAQGKTAAGQRSAATATKEWGASLRTQADALGAIQKRIGILTEGTRQAGTQAESLTRLRTVEAQLQKALEGGNLTLTQRIKLGGALEQASQAVADAEARIAASAGQTTPAFATMSDAVTALARDTGESSKGLAALAAAANRVGVSAPEFGAGLKAFTANLAGLRSGSVDAVKAFEAVGVSAKELEGLSIDAAMAKVAHGLKDVESGGARAAATIGLFGREGAALSPFLHDLALTAPAAEAASHGIGELGESIKHLAEIMAAVEVLRFVRETVTWEDEMGKLAQKVGATTEQLSVLSVAAATADVSQEGLQTGLRQLAKSVEDLRAGTPQAAGAFRQLGLSARDFKGLNTAEALLTVADAQERFADGTGKAAIAMKLFGRDGVEMIPLLHSLANDGFSRVREEAERLGVVITEDMAKSAEQFNDDLTLMGLVAKGAAAQVAGTVIPALSAMLESLRKGIEAMPQWAKTFVTAAAITATALVGLGAAAAIAAAGFAALDVAALPAIGVLAAVSLAIGGLAALAGKLHSASIGDAITVAPEQVESARKLGAEYQTLAAQIESGALKGAKLEAAQRRLKEITEKLIAIDPAYRDALDKEGQSADQTAAAIERVTQKRVADLRAQLAAADAEVQRLQDLAAAASKVGDSNPVGFKGVAHLEQQMPMVRLTRQLDDAKAHADALRKALEAIDTAASGAGAKPNPPQPVDKTLLDAQIAAARQAAQQALAVTQASIKMREQLEAGAYQRGLVAVDTYYADRMARVREGTAAEVTAITAEVHALQRQLRDAETPADRLKIQTDIRAAVARRQAAEQEGERQVNALVQERLQTVRQLDSQVVAFLGQLDTLRGDTLAAQLREVEQQTADFRRLLGQSSLPPEVQADTLAQFQALATARANAAEQQRRFDLESAALERGKLAIQQQVDQHQIGQEEGERRIAALEQARLPALRAIADQMLAFAQQIGDPELIASAQRVEQELGGMGQHLTAAQVAARDFGRSLKETATQGIESILTNLGDIPGAIVGIIGQVQQLAAHLVALKLGEKLFGSGDAPAKAAAAGGAIAAGGAVVGASAVKLAGSAVALDASGGILIRAAGALTEAAAALALATNLSSIQSGVAGIAAAAGSLLPFAAGGYVNGPGTSTSDSIPARLSAGEFVVRAAAVQRVGVEYLDALNGLHLPPVARVGGISHYASGGLVQGGAAGGSHVTVAGEIGLADGLVAHQMTGFIHSSSGAREMVKFTVRNRKAMRDALGIG